MEYPREPDGFPAFYFVNEEKSPARRVGRGIGRMGILRMTRAQTRLRSCHVTGPDRCIVRL